MEKKDLTICSQQKTEFKYKDINRLKYWKRHTIQTLIKRKQKWLHY